MGNEEYDRNYIEACFFIWYKNGAPGLATSRNVVPVGARRLLPIIPLTSDGRKPTITTLASWMDKYAWRERADALDAEVSVRLEEQTITERIATLKQLAEDGKTLKTAGLDFISKTEDPFKENPSAAVRAIVAGSEMQSKYSGQVAILENIATMTPKQIQDEILKLLGKESSEQNENENIDAELEDISGEDGDTENNDS